MTTTARDRVYEFIGRFETIGTVNDSTDLFVDGGIEGDDAFEFIDKFGGEFEVELENYRWYFHHGEEGINYGGIFFRPPYKRVPHIPVTPSLLIAAVESGQWPIAYPPHTVPEVRWDLRLNLGCLILAIALAVSVWIYSQLN